MVQVLQAARRSGELEPQLVGVQRLHVVAERLVELVAAVLPVAEKRMPHMREMRAYLVSPPGQQVDLQQRVPAPGLEHAVLREYRAVLRGLAVGDDHAVLVGQLLKVGGQRVGALRKLPLHNAEVQLDKLPVAYFLVEHPQRLRVLRGYDYPAGVAVDTVAQRRNKALLAIRVVLPLLPEVTFYAVYQRVGGVVVVLVYHHSDRLVAQKYIFVLVYHVYFRRDLPEIRSLFPASGVKQLVAQVKPEHVPLAELHVRFGSGSVELYPLLSHQLADKRQRQVRVGFGEESVGALPGVVFGYCYLGHNFLSVN